MTFRPFNPETFDELQAIQAELDAMKLDDVLREQQRCMLDWVSSNPNAEWPESIHSIFRSFNTKLARRNELERDRDAIYQADYDLSRQHR